MDLYLSEKVVLVAGSTRGIGLATARAFLSEGCRTVITGRDERRLTGIRTELEAEFGTERVLAFARDLSQIANIRNTLADIRQTWGRLDCLVANIGSGRGPVGWELNETEWFNLFELNLWASLRLATEALPEMVNSGQGSVVLIASIVGKESTPAPLPYSAAKAALINFSKNLSRQTGQHNVRVNCVAPGNVLFPGGSWENHLKERNEEVLSYIHSEVPLRRFGRPEEIADLIVFLSSDRASYITGTCVVADGGQTRSI